VYEDEDCVYLVTDLALYGDLHAHIIKVKLMSQETAAKILHSLLTAVSFLHNNGIIHRDIKPENILLHSATDASQLVLADFGLA
jgi:serine/threonine protein kinase